MSLLLAVGAVLAVAGALGVVLSTRPVHSVLAMVLNFIGLALVYLSLQAEFLAVIQIIIYAGAVMVLFLFVIALLTAANQPVESKVDTLALQGAGGVVLGGLLIALLGATALSGDAGAGAAVSAAFGGVAAFGRSLLTTHLLSFEILAFVLMVAVIGVVVLVGRER
ncbi:MAG TPA: NADH-quinone oxidoreductase subunit J [Limnochordia bacterium]